jgi:hypothetical protein
MMNINFYYLFKMKLSKNTDFNCLNLDLGLFFILLIFSS